ncbi:MULTISPECIES: hypothetical protein [Lysinibacillus]|nr:MULTISPECIES: hypothetical protein [Lysinibacillus]MED4545656.1 hypothetical protein [Lysinibacillus sphaericus]GEC82828.1 hypothetical protein LSP03_25710 [Lysinibacillus sphaericus]
MFILSIRSKRWNIAMQHIYFAEKLANTRKPMKLVCHTHSLVPSRKLIKREAVHIRLTDHEYMMLSALSKNTRKLLRRAQEESYQVFLYKEPSEDNLRAFQQFYNEFAKRKKIDQINKLQMEAIMLLNQQQALLLSEVRSICGQTLCYRLDIVHAQKAMSYYVATCHASALPTHLKRPMRYANRFLLWHNFMYLKQQGFVLYDMGELTDIETVRQFKLSFGGQVVNVYSGYIAHSRISALLLGVQKWRK